MYSSLLNGHTVELYCCPQLSLLPTSTIIECGCLTSNGQWLVCVSTCRLLPGTLTAERRPFGDVFPLPLWQAIAASVCSAHLGSQDEADIPYSLRTNRGRHDVRKKKISGVFGHWDFGVVCSPPWSRISWRLLTFVSEAQYDLTSTDFSELFPHLFSLSPLSVLLYLLP